MAPDVRPYRRGCGLFKATAKETVAGGGRLKAIIPITWTTVSSGPAPHVLLTHNQIWNAIDRLAARAKLTASGLAKKAGLDPTTFNKSKRITPEGRPRWPSTESVAKALPPPAPRSTPSST